MKRCTAAVLLALSALSVTGASAAERGRRQLYAQRADLLVEGPGLARLTLPADVLAQCRPDGADLLILDIDGAEVPYAFDSGVDLDQVREVVETAPAEILETLRGETSDAAGERFYLERFEIVRPPAAAGATQLLLVEAGRRGSVEAEAMYARRADRVWTAAPIDLGSGSRGGWGHEIELPDDLGERVTVTLRGRDPRAAPPVLLFRSVRLQTQERVRVPLDVVSRRDEASATWVDLSRPPGWRIDALEVETSTAAFSRRLTIYDVPPHGAAVEVGRSVLARLGGAAAEANLISLAPLRGEHLRIGIRNADSPPLADLRFFAVVRRPALVFPVRGVHDGRAGTLLFGGGRVRRPHYDLQDIASGGDPTARAEMFDASLLAAARLGPLEANPDFEERPVLHFAMQPGAEIDADDYHYHRSVRVSASADGLSLLPLGADDLARTRADLADLRVVDAQGRQWPYLLRRGDDSAWMEARLRRGKAEPGQTRLLIELPTAPRAVPVDRLSLLVANLYFQRPFELLAYDRGGQARTVVRATLRNEIDESGPVEIAFAELRAVGLEMVIEDGDDAPLRVETARVRHSVPTLFLVAPPGSYVLLLGDPEATAPHYELASIREVVYSLAGAEARVGRLTTNPDYVPPPRRWRGARGWRNAQVLLVWGSLIGAVVVLAILTLRQVRAERGPGPEA